MNIRNKKPSRKEKILAKEIAKRKFEISQRKSIKVLAIFLIILIVAVGLIIGPNTTILKSPFDTSSLLIIIVCLFLLVWIFVYIPWVVLTTNKKIKVNDSLFEIESNRQRYKTKRNLKELVYWDIISSIEAGDYICLKFQSKRILLSYSEYKGLQKLEQVLKSNYNHKKKAKK